MCFISDLSLILSKDEEMVKGAEDGRWKICGHDSEAVLHATPGTPYSSL